MRKKMRNMMRKIISMRKMMRKMISKLSCVTGCVRWKHRHSKENIADQNSKSHSNVIYWYKIFILSRIKRLLFRIWLIRFRRKMLKPYVQYMLTLVLCYFYHSSRCNADCLSSTTNDNLGLPPIFTNVRPMLYLKF